MEDAHKVASLTVKKQKSRRVNAGKIRERDESTEDNSEKIKRFNRESEKIEQTRQQVNTIFVQGMEKETDRYHMEDKGQHQTQSRRPSRYWEQHKPNLGKMLYNNGFKSSPPSKGDNKRFWREEDKDTRMGEAAATDRQCDKKYKV